MRLDYFKTLLNIGLDLDRIIRNYGVTEEEVVELKKYKEEIENE